MRLEPSEIIDNGKVLLPILLLLGLGATDDCGAKLQRTQAGSPIGVEKMDIMKAMVGSWEGSVKTWFQPGKLADESKLKGEFKPLLGGTFVRHTYEGSMQGKPRTGEETIVYNKLEKKVQVSWFDTFHMNYGFLFSEGEKSETGFSVTGRYRMAPDQDAWSWKTVFEMSDQDHLTITAYNILPSGQESKAVEIIYTRTKPR